MSRDASQTDGTPATSVRPLLAAALAVAGAVGYGLVLGYPVTASGLGALVTLCLAFGGLGSGVAFATRDRPAVVGTGVVVFLVLPPLRAWVFGPDPPGALAAVGVTAVAVFLLAVGVEWSLRRPAAVRRLLTSRDALAGAGFGAALTVPVFLAWSPPPTVYSSTAVRLVAILVVGVRGAFLAAAVGAVVLWFTRKRAVTPALVAGYAFAVATLGGGEGYTVWGATPDYLATKGVVLLILVFAAGLLETAVRGSIRGLRTAEA